MNTTAATPAFEPMSGADLDRMLAEPPEALRSRGLRRFASAIDYTPPKETGPEKCARLWVNLDEPE